MCKLYLKILSCTFGMVPILCAEAASDHVSSLIVNAIFDEERNVVFVKRIAREDISDVNARIAYMEIPALMANYRVEHSMKDTFPLLVYLQRHGIGNFNKHTPAYFDFSPDLGTTWMVITCSESKHWLNRFKNPELNSVINIENSLMPVVGSVENITTNQDELGAIISEETNTSEVVEASRTMTINFKESKYRSDRVGLMSVEDPNDCIVPIVNGQVFGEHSLDLMNDLRRVYEYRFNYKELVDYRYQTEIVKSIVHLISVGAMLSNDFSLNISQDRTMAWVYDFIVRLNEEDGHRTVRLEIIKHADADRALAALRKRLSGMTALYKEDKSGVGQQAVKISEQHILFRREHYTVDIVCDSDVSAISRSVDNGIMSLMGERVEEILQIPGFSDI